MIFIEINIYYTKKMFYCYKVDIYINLDIDFINLLKRLLTLLQGKKKLVD